MKSFVIALSVALFSTLAAAADYSGSGYEGAEMRRMQTQSLGTIEDIREVTMQDRSSIAKYGSQGVGGLIGGVLGRELAGNNSAAKTIAVSLGAVVGAVAGETVSEAVSTSKALEFVVVTDDGRAVVITQAIDDQAKAIGIGDRVRLVQGASTRVVKLRTRVM